MRSVVLFLLAGVAFGQKPFDANGYEQQQAQRAANELQNAQTELLKEQTAALRAARERDAKAMTNDDMRAKYKILADELLNTQIDLTALESVLMKKGLLSHKELADAIEETKTRLKADVKLAARPGISKRTQ